MAVFTVPPTLQSFGEVVAQKFERPESRGGFNGSMQHTGDCVSRRSVADEAKTEDLLHGKSESVDVGALAERGVPSADRPVV
jgi:hypothetical protein